MSQDQEPAEQPAPKKRLHFVRAKAYQNGSTGPLRHSILQVLGVLKVATVKQTWLLAQPDHEFPNTVASGLRDLMKNKLTEQRGTTSGLPSKQDPADADPAAAPEPKSARPKGQPKRKPVRPVGAGAVIWGLTDLGLDAAKSTLPSSRKVGGRARSVGRATGAPHAMAVNDTIVAFTSPATPGEPIGTIADWVTEAPHPLPGDRTQFADAVLTAPADGVPLLLVEVDLHNETPEFIAAKFDRYAEYFALTYKDPTHEGHHSDADKLPTWRRRYPMADPDSLPPIALVLAGAGPRGLNNLIDKVKDLTRKHWRPTSLNRWKNGDPFDFTGSIPILACHLDRLKEHGPHAAIWWRFGANEWQTLHDALAHTEYRARVQARLDAEAQDAHEAEERRLEATRCPTCDRRADEFDDQRCASDGTKSCWDCRQKAAADAAEKKQQAVRDAHAKRWPCWTCKGPLGGAFDSVLELTEEAPAEALECPSCEIDRRNNGLGRLLLPKPTRSEERQARKGQLNDPWWEMRQLHAKQWPARSSN
ncbi:replication-relaxation family protein [Kitasatospora sp. MBT66]|uniref:replication-relaxation family protein n=1 Tax=Kitasatospora sp. MBT66 TaxID=1444769 RepID=UPI0005B9EBAC|nr:replication-relaxation family protein [Kitasatospora sp. MBT66]